MEIRLESLYRTLCVDPAGGASANSDEAAITVVGFDRERALVFILEEWGQRILPAGLIAQIFNLYEKWKPHRIGIEKAALQSVFLLPISDEMVRRGCFFNVEMIGTGNESKGARIRERLQPFIANHQIYFRRDQSKLIKELTDFRVSKGQVIGRNPNRLDSLAMHTEFWRAVKSDYESADDIPWDEMEKKDNLPAVYGLKTRTYG